MRVASLPVPFAQSTLSMVEPTMKGRARRQVTSVVFDVTKVTRCFNNVPYLLILLVNTMRLIKKMSIGVSPNLCICALGATQQFHIERNRP
jgi:hypothetical protein